MGLATHRVASGGPSVWIPVIVGIVIGLLGLGLPLIGVTVNLPLGMLILTVAFGLIARGFWIWEGKSPRREWLRIATISAIAVLYFSMIGRQVYFQYKKDHPAQAASAPNDLPKSPEASAQAPPPDNEQKRDGAPRLRPRHPSKTAAPAQITPPIVQLGNGNTAAPVVVEGSITPKGNCDVTQVGGTNNTASPTCITAPPAPQCFATPLSEPTEMQDGSYTQEFHIKLLAASSVGSLAVRASSPGVVHLRLEGEGVHSSHNDFGYNGQYTRNFDNVKPGDYIVTVEMRTADSVLMDCGQN